MTKCSLIVFFIKKKTGKLNNVERRGEISRPQDSFRYGTNFRMRTNVRWGEHAQRFIKSQIL